MGLPIGLAQAKALHVLKSATLRHRQEYRQLRTVQRAPSRNASDFFHVRPAFVDVRAAAHYEVRVRTALVPCVASQLVPALSLTGGTSGEPPG